MSFSLKASLHPSSIGFSIPWSELVLGCLFYRDHTRGQYWHIDIYWLQNSWRHLWTTPYLPRDADLSIRRFRDDSVESRLAAIVRQAVDHLLELISALTNDILVLDSDHIFVVISDDVSKSESGFNFGRVGLNVALFSGFFRLGCLFPLWGSIQFKKSAKNRLIFSKYHDIVN